MDKRAILEAERRKLVDVVANLSLPYKKRAAAAKRIAQIDRALYPRRVPFRS